jgi:dipeptide transport system substrate-binding protein
MKAGTPEKFDQEPVGTGPFLRVNYQKDTTIRYKAHAAYWRGKAPIDDSYLRQPPTPRCAIPSCAPMNAK